jgi:hypothetical protein
MTPCCWTLFPILGVLALQPAPSVTSAPAPADHWEGTIQTPGQALAIEVDLARPAATGTLISLDQGAAEIPVTAITQTASHVTVGVSAIGGTFDGEMKDRQLIGTWAQGDATMPLALTRSHK